MRPVILLFAKAPLPGHVKTRLAAAIGDSNATALHVLFVRSLLPRLSRLADCELYLDIPSDAFADCAVTTRIQQGTCLGERLFNAFEQSLRLFSPVVILGSDSPTVPDESIDALLNSPAAITIAPCDDGGYWGIAASRIHPQMFQDVRWSTDTACKDTIFACEQAGLSPIATGPRWFDIDEAADLPRIADFLERSGFLWHPQESYGTSTR